MEGSPYQVMPPPSEEEYAALKADIADRGIQQPIVEDGEGNVLDGHTRLRAYHELLAEGHKLGRYPRTIRNDLETDVEKRTEARKENSLRRHLSSAKKRQVVEDQLRDTPDWADSRIAGLLGVDGKTVRSVRMSLELREELPKVDMLLGKDGKYYPRSRTGDFEAELAQTKTDAVRQEVLNQRRVWQHGSDEDVTEKTQEIAQKWGVSPEHVEDQRKDMEEHGARLKDLGEEELVEVLAEADKYAYGNMDQRVARLVRDKMRDLADIVTGYGGKKKKYKAKPEEAAESVVEYYMRNHQESVRRFDEDAASMVRTDLERYRSTCAWIQEFVSLLEEKLEKRIAIEREVSELRHGLQEEEGIKPPPA